MSSKLKPWLMLAVIFVAGIFTGIALTVAFPSHFKRPPEPRESRNHMLEFLTRRLNLTADQQVKVQPILADTETKLRALHRDELDRGAQIFKATDDQISAILTPDQKAELQKMESEREKMFPGHMHPWGGSHEGPGGEFRHDEGGDNPPPPPPGPPPIPAPDTNAAPSRGA